MGVTHSWTALLCNASIKDAKDITLVSWITDKKRPKGVHDSCPAWGQKAN